MRVKWEKRNARTFVASGEGRYWMRAWTHDRDTWHAEVSDAPGANAAFIASHFALPSERAAKREAVRMWRALRGAK